MKRKIILPITLLAVAALPLRGDDADYAKIRAGIRQLAPMVGSWKTVWDFYEKDGVTEEVGTTEINYVLDETYLQLVVERHNPANPARNKKMITYITYNPLSSRYDATY